MVPSTLEDDVAMARQLAAEEERDYQTHCDQSDAERAQNNKLMRAAEARRYWESAPAMAVPPEHCVECVVRGRVQTAQAQDHPDSSGNCRFQTCCDWSVPFGCGLPEGAVRGQS